MEKTRPSLLQRVADLTDQRSWSEFVAFYEPLLRSYVRKQGARDDYTVEDLVQTILVSLLRRLPTFQYDPAKGRFRTWLWQVAHNAVIDWQRATIQHNERLNQLRRDRAGQTSRPEDEWDRLHHQRILECVLEREKARQQAQPTTAWACFDLHLLQGKSGADVSAQLGIPIGTVYVNASRMLARIREQCAAYRKELGDE